jgi:hypothetical protein
VYTFTVLVSEAGASAEASFDAAAVEREDAGDVEPGGDEPWVARRTAEAREGHLYLRRQRAHQRLAALRGGTGKEARHVGVGLAVARQFWNDGAEVAHWRRWIGLRREGAHGRGGD